MNVATIQALTVALQIACGNVTGTDGTIIWYDGNQTAQCVQAAQSALTNFVPSNPTTIPTAAFLSRFTPTEQAAVWSAIGKDATGQLGALLTNGLANGQITLNDSKVTQFMAALVASGAITQARSTIITTP